MVKAPATATAPASTSPAILAEQVDLLYRQSPPGFVATVFNATVLVAGIWPVSNTHVLLGWYGVLLTITLLRLLLVRAYRAHVPVAAQAPVWRSRFAFGALLVGTCWGFAGTFLYPLHSVMHQVFVLLVIAGMSAGAIPLLSVVQPVYMAYVFPILIPMAINMLWQREELYVYSGAMVLIFATVLYITSRRIASNIQESLTLRYENTGLVKNLEESNRQLAAANARLSAEVDERKRAERGLRDSHQFLEKVMDGATDAIFVVDEGGRLVRVNRAMEIITGYSATDLLGKHVTVLFKPVDAGVAIHRLERLFEKGDTIRHTEIEILRGDGAVRILSLSAGPLYEDEHVTALVGTAEDITEKKVVERMKSEFVSTVSHELRTPLTSIHGSLSLISSGVTGDMNDKLRSMIDVARKNSGHLMTLIDDLLDIQKLELGEVHFDFAEHDLPALVLDVVDAHRGFASGYDVNYRLAAPMPAARVRLDADRFRQVLSNLLSNAAKFSPPGEDVEIAVECRDGWVRVVVSDHGPGIPEDFKPRIFQKFAQADSTDARRRGGTGLGLSIARSLVDHMNGRIGYTGRDGGGTTFFVEFPLC